LLRDAPAQVDVAPDDFGSSRLFVREGRDLAPLTKQLSAWDAIQKRELPHSGVDSSAPRFDREVGFVLFADPVNADIADAMDKRGADVFNERLTLAPMVNCKRFRTGFDRELHGCSLVAKSATARRPWM